VRHRRHQVSAALPHGHRTLVHRGQEAAEVGDGVGAELGLRAVRGSAGEGHLDHGEAAQRPGEREVGRLRDQAHVGADAQPGQGSDHGLAPEVGVLLVGGQREHGPHRRPGRRERLGGDDRRGHTRLHVGRAATTQPVALDARRERLGHTGDADGVEVAIEQHGRPRCRSGGHRDQARAVGVTGRGDDGRLEARPVEP
jgi:hypothetical protein